MEFETILYTKENGIATITMNRPEVHNAQNRRMVLEMDEAFLDADMDEQVKVVILQGAGKSFSAGHDLKGDPVEKGGYDLSDKSVEARWRWERDLFFEKAMRSWRLRKPVIAKVQGHCIAAGFMIANLCDLIIAADNAKFGDPVTRMGNAGVEVFVHPWVLPPRKAKELLFTGNTIDAETAYHFGMVNHVVPLEELDNKTQEIAEQIAQMPPFAISQVKNSINRMMDMMGFYNSLNAFFDTHHMLHATRENKTIQEQYWQNSKSLKEFFNKRDERFETK